MTANVHGITILRVFTGISVLNTLGCVRIVVNYVISTYLETSVNLVIELSGYVEQAVTVHRLPAPNCPSLAADCSRPHHLTESTQWLSETSIKEIISYGMFIY